MKIIKTISNGLLILIGVSVGLYAIEVLIFPKQVNQFQIDNTEFENSEILDINFKLRANKCAVGNSKESNGWYVSENISQDIEDIFSKKDVFLQINESELSLIEDKYLANKLYLVNNSSEKICLSAQDSRLYLKMQAKNMLGNWQDIEYIPNSWCGNSYHEICLESKKFWEFSSFLFKGRHKTKFRYKLENKGNDIFSNEIEGFVNNGQFINTQKYFPIDLTDPYNE